MKTIKIMAVMFFISGITVFAQNLWKTEVPLNFTVQSNTKVSSFVDENGIHIVYFRNGGIRYALANSQGSVIKYDKVIESEGSGTDFTNVVANGNNVFAVYHKSNKIRVARSTNLGDSWNTTFSSFDLINTDCNKIVAYRDGSNIKITWSERRVGSSDNDVHYINFSPSPNPAWSEYRRVSENESSGGDNPDFAFTSEKVEVNYTSFYQPKNRERLSNGSWNNSESIPYNQFPVTIIKGVKPLIVGSTLNVIYSGQWSGMFAGGDYISHSYRDMNQTNWIQNYTMLETNRLVPGEIYPHISANTADGKIHLIYWEYDSFMQVQRWSYRQLSGTIFSNHIAEIPLSSLSTSINAVSNDLFLIRTDNPLTPGNIKLIHYDAAPLSPENYAVSVYQSGNNRYPKLTWSLNNEPDVRNNDQNAYKIERRTRQAPGDWSNWSVLTNLSGSVSSFIDYTINTAGSGDKEAEYRITANDLGNNTSPSQSIVITFGMGWADKISVPLTVNDYSLSQNYPNPFNPSTKISYSTKEDGFVTLKVYDILGVEIATLVNEQKTAGSYEAEFKASNLPSGIYIYKLQSGSFTDVKKMLLTK